MRFPKIVIDPLKDSPWYDWRAIGWEFYWTAEWHGRRVGGYAHSDDQAYADALRAGHELQHEGAQPWHSD